MNNFTAALEQDSDLSQLPRGSELCQVLQTLFICTGCDYVSYLKYIGKASVLNNFFQYA